MKKAIYILLFAALGTSCHKKNTASSPAEDTLPTPAAASGNMENSTTAAAPAQEGKQETDGESKSQDIKWMSYEEAVKAAKKKPKKIFVDVYTDWCGWCKKMDKTTLKDPKISSYMNQKYYAVKVNAESDKSVVYQGKQMTEKELASRVFRITGYPSTVYLEPSEKIIQPVPGFMDVPTLDKILHYVGEDYYKTQTWEQFQMSYTGE